jgi:AcrR family transcriptional regulator
MLEGYAESTNVSLRRTLDASNDPRVAATREAIVRAASALAGSPTDATVSGIAKRAGVSRSSFYSHFASLDDLVVFIQKRAFEQIALVDDDHPSSSPVLSPRETLQRAQERLVTHFAEHRGLYSAVLALSTPRRVHERTAAVFADLIEGYLWALPHVPDAISPSIASVYIANAGVGVLDSWILGDIDAAPEEIVHHLMALMPAWIAAD